RRSGTDSPETRKARHSRSRAGQRKWIAVLLRQAVNALAVLAFGGFDLEPHLLPQGAADEPAYRMRLPAGGFHNLGDGSALRTLNQRQYGGGLAAFPDPASFRSLGLFGPFGGLLFGGRLLGSLPLRRRTLRALFATFGLPFRFAGLGFGSQLRILGGS